MTVAERSAALADTSNGPAKWMPLISATLRSLPRRETSIRPKVRKALTAGKVGRSGGWRQREVRIRWRRRAQAGPLGKVLTAAHTSTSSGVTLEDEGRKPLRARSAKRLTEPVPCHGPPPTRQPSGAKPFEEDWLQSQANAPACARDQRGWRMMTLFVSEV